MKAQTIRKEERLIKPMSDYGVVTIDWDDKEKAGKQLSAMLKKTEESIRQNGVLSSEEVLKRFNR